MIDVNTFYSFGIDFRGRAGTPTALSRPRLVPAKNFLRLNGELFVLILYFAESILRVSMLPLCLCPSSSRGVLHSGHELWNESGLGNNGVRTFDFVKQYGVMGRMVM